MNGLKRLEQNLAIWEDQMLLTRCLLERQEGTGVPYGELAKMPIAGPLKHYSDLRKDILNSLSPLVTPEYMIKKYLEPMSVIGYFLKNGGSTMVNLPAALYDWTRTSRRVYELSEDLQFLLEVTNMDELTWGDIHWPFESFVLSLPIPLADSSGIVSFDTILVSRNYTLGEPMIQFDLYSTDIDGYKPITFREKELLERKRKNRRWNELLGDVEKLSRRFEQRLRVSTFFISSADKNKLVTTSITETERNKDRFQVDYIKQLGKTIATKENIEHPEWNSAARLVVGLCMYIGSLQKSKHISYITDWDEHGVPYERKQSSTGLTEEAHVCTVRSSFELTDVERQMLRKVMEQGGPLTESIRAQFRTGHWRRPPGTGHIPDWPKTVWVRPALIGRLTLPDGELPVGALNTVTVLKNNKDG